MILRRMHHCVYWFLEYLCHPQNRTDASIGDIDDELQLFDKIIIQSFHVQFELIENQNISKLIKSGVQSNFSNLLYASFGIQEGDTHMYADESGIF